MMSAALGDYEEGHQAALLHLSLARARGGGAAFGQAVEHGGELGT